MSCTYPECRCTDAIGICEAAEAAGFTSFLDIAITRFQDEHVTCCRYCGNPAGDPHGEDCLVND